MDVIDDQELVAIEAAGNLIEELDIPELKKACPAFSAIRPWAARFRAEKGLP